MPLFQDQGAPDNNRNYAVNADGQIIGNGKSRYFFANGQNVGSLLLTHAGSTWQIAESIVYGFAFNVDDGVVSGADVQTPTTVDGAGQGHVALDRAATVGRWQPLVRAGRRERPDDPDAQLVEGMIIRVPNEIVSVGNNASVYKP